MAAHRSVANSSRTRSSSSLVLSRDDFSTIFADDIELTDVRYSGSSIYKYYYFTDLQIQRKFFAKPTLKFAHKSELNDPFELSRRWVQFGCPFTKAIFDKYVRGRFEARLDDIGIMTKKIRERAQESGIPLSRQQVRRFLHSREGRFEISKEREAVVKLLDTMSELLPKTFQEHEAELIESFTRETGILSLTEDPQSPRMWHEYAGADHGFVLEFDAQHELFSRTTDDGNNLNLLRRVFYRDDRIDDFWKNPNYLFLVKESKWEYEKEWRMIKSLEQCQRHIQPDGQFIYLVDVPRRLISSVTFGHQFPTDLIDDLSSLLLKYDGNIKIRRAVPLQQA